MTPIRLGTRASPLALAQVGLVRAALIAAHGLRDEDVVLVPMVATGDRILDRALAEVGGKALWTKELDQALAQGQIDAAVHSMKDVETRRPPHFQIVAMLARADVRDRLIGAPRIVTIRQGARVGTSSPRRRAQLLRLRPDLDIVLLRGNVATRLRAVADGAVEATLLASAGLARLGLDDGTPVPIETLLPAPAQGAIGIEIRANDARLAALMRPINHPETFACVSAERALLSGLGGDCHSAIAALAQPEDGMLSLRAEIYAADGQEMVRKTARFALDDPAAARAVAHSLLADASPALRAAFAAT